jgi:ABC-type branched-subunit amino acid transport system substrate-binding protein
VKDDKVFAVLGVSDDVGPCASVQYHVPYISTGGLATEQEYFTQSHNYVISSGATAERTGENWASFLVSSGTIAGHKVGMINLKDGGVQELSGDAAANVLQQLGHPLTDREQVPNDGSASAATIAVQAHNMQSKGVDMVMLNTSFATAVQFMTAAQANHYYPRYLTSDTGSLASDGLLSKAPKVLNGAIGLTGGFYLAQARSGEPEPADMKACRTEFNAASKTQIAYGEASPLSIVCTDIDILQRGALNAGTDLTRANFVNAIQHVGGWELPGLFSGYSAPGRTDFNNATQPLRWLSSCQCYHTAGPVIPDKY